MHSGRPRLPGLCGHRQETSEKRNSQKRPHVHVQTDYANSCPSGCPSETAPVADTRTAKPPRDLKNGREGVGGEKIQRSTWRRRELAPKQQATSQAMYIGHAWAALQCGKLSSTLCSDSSSNYYRRNLIMHDAKRKGTNCNRHRKQRKQGEGRGEGEGNEGGVLSVVCDKGSVHSK